MKVNLSMDQERADHYPAWLVLQFPVIRAIRDNPLALFLSGLAYGRQRWFRRSAAMPPAPIEAYLMQPAVAAAAWATFAVFNSMFLMAFALIVLLPVFLVVWRHAVWEHWWRRMAQVVNMQEWRLSMVPKDIALGIAWGAILRSMRGHCIAAMAWPLVFIAAHFTLMRVTNGVSDMILYAFAIIIGVLLQCAIFVDSIYATFVSLSVGAKCASRPRRETPLAARLKTVASGAIHQWFRLGVSATAGWILGAILMSMVYLPIRMALNTGPASGNRGEAIYLCSVGVCALGWFVSFYALFIRRMMDNDYYKAVDAESFDLRDIFEANSAGPGGNT